MKLTVVIPTYDPDPGRLRKTLEGLEGQSIARELWELVVVDNASPTPLSDDQINAHFSGNYRLVRENTPGLSHARLCGITEANSELIIFSDDDNVFAPDYLEGALDLMTLHPDVGVAGGKSHPNYEVPPPAWYVDGMAPLGCRDLGSKKLTMSAADYAASKIYPEFAPIGAGMVFRKKAAATWMVSARSGEIPDRKGKSLSSAGDCDMILHALESGWAAAYWPRLVLDHLLPETRLTPTYLGAISRAAFRDYIKVLDRHGIRPWKAIPPWTLLLRKSRAWLRNRPWSGPEAFIRWSSAVGNLEGRASLPS